MKIKKYLKQFFSLDRHHAGGFTLVELIVVIAILAILAGVGVPAYSGYVTKANQQADITLASDIENALLLAYYDQKLESGASVIVYYGGQAADTVKADDGVTDYGAAAAMEAAFGSGWTSLSLAYNGWDNAAGSVVADYKDSSFEGSEAGLLDDVQNLTDAFKTFIGDQEDIESYTGEEFTKFLAENGIVFEEGQEVSEETQQKMANLLALYVAQRTEKANTDNDAFVDAFVAAWYTDGSPIDAFQIIDTGNGPMGLVGALAATYARGEALVKFFDQNSTKTFSVTEDKLDAKGNPVVDAEGNNVQVTYTSATEWFSAQPVNSEGATSGVIKNNLFTLNRKTAELLWRIDEDTANAYFYGTDAGQAEEDKQYYKDALAYLSVMGAVNTSAPALKKNLNSENLYNDGTVETLLNSYIAAGKALAGAPANAMVVVFTETATGADVVAYPIDYVN